MVFVWRLDQEFFTFFGFILLLSCWTRYMKVSRVWCVSLCVHLFWFRLWKLDIIGLKFVFYCDLWSEHEVSKDKRTFRCLYQVVFDYDTAFAYDFTNAVGSLVGCSVFSLIVCGLDFRRLRFYRTCIDVEGILFLLHWLWWFSSFAVKFFRSVSFCQF